MSKLFGRVLNRYQRIASSISLLPDDDYENTFSHSTHALEEKVMKRTAAQMRDVMIDYLKENPELIDELYRSIAKENNVQLQLELEENIRCAKKYGEKRQRQHKFAF